MATVIHLVCQQVLKAVIRIEKKVDESLRLTLKATETAQGNLPDRLQPLNDMGQSCPMCIRPIQYKTMEMAPGYSVTFRECGCEPQPNQLPIKGEDL